MIDLPSKGTITITMAAVEDEHSSSDYGRAEVKIDVTELEKGEVLVIENDVEVYEKYGKGQGLQQQ